MPTLLPTSEVANGPVAFGPPVEHDTSPKRSRIFAALVFVTMVVSSFVIVEPAPVDALMIGLLVFGTLAGFLNFRYVAPLALIPLAGFVLANITSMYDPLDFTHATFYLLVTVYLAASWVFFVGFFSRYGRDGVRLVAQGWTVAAIICVSLGLLSYFHIIGYQDYLLRFGRPKGVFKDPNVFGPYLVPIALFAFTGITFKKKTFFTASMNASIFAFLAFGVFVSYSRAAWINFLASLVLYFVFALFIRPTGTPLPFSLGKVGVFLGVGFLALFLAAQIPEIQDMLAKRVTSNGLQNYDRDRFRTHQLARQSAIERPFGIGPGQAEETFQYATHSSYMRALSENGFFGLATYVFFVLVCLGFGLKKVAVTTDPFWIKVYLIASSCIVGHIINSYVVDTIHWRHYWLILALPFVPVDKDTDTVPAQSPWVLTR